jgi:hypothetical protein
MTLQTSLRAEATGLSVAQNYLYTGATKAQRAIWERLVGQLSESIRKSDYRFQGEAWGEESGAWLRAIAALVGARPDQGRRRAQPVWSFSQPDRG